MLGKLGFSVGLVREAREKPSLQDEIKGLSGPYELQKEWRKC